MAEIQDLVVVDDSNIGRWPENMEFSDVNDAGRADEGILARWYKDMDSSIVASGSSNAFAITSNRTIAALFNNLVIAWTANHSITGASTLALNGLAAKAIKRFNGDALASGDIISGQPMVTIYKSSPDQWFMVSAPAAATGNMFADFDENGAPGTPAANAARLYAFDDATVTRLAYKDNAGNITTLLPVATQAEMEARTADRLVAVARQHFHPGHPKAGGNLDGSGTPAFRTGDYGMGAVTDNGLGNYELAFDTAFNSTDYWMTGFARFNDASSACGIVSALSNTPKAASAMTIRTANSTTGANFIDSTEVGVSFWGDYA